MKSKAKQIPHLVTNPAKFTLYIKAHEIKEVQRSLQRVLLLPKAERREWIEAYGDLLQDAFDDFLEASDLALENLSFDDETLQLSEDFVVSLRDTVSMVEGIFEYEGRKLRS